MDIEGKTHTTSGTSKGKLTIFLGICCGIGKTESMISEALHLKNKGLDVFIASLNRKQHPQEYEMLIDQNNPDLNPNWEIDVESIIKRAPALVVIDEYAHMNPRNKANTFRYQDIDEILDAGIDVYTTLNITQIESKSLVVKEKFNLLVIDTIPDSKFYEATYVKMTNIAIEEIIVNIKNIQYTGFYNNIEFIIDFFSHQKNIMFLNEMGRQIVAMKYNHCEKDLNLLNDEYSFGIKVLVCIDHSASAEQLLYKAKNISVSLGGTLYAFYPEIKGFLSDEQKIQLNKNIKLAYKLGAFFTSDDGKDWYSMVSNIIEKENITHLIIGWSPKKHILKMPFVTNPVEKLAVKYPQVNLYIIFNEKKKEHHSLKKKYKLHKAPYKEYACIALITVLFFLILMPFSHILSTQEITYLSLIILVIESIFYMTGPILFGSILSSFFIDFFYTYPLGETHLLDDNFLLFILFLAIPFTQSSYMNRIKRSEENSRKREERIRAMVCFAEQLSSSIGIDEVIHSAIESIRTGFRFENAFYILNDTLPSIHNIHPSSNFTINEKELEIVKWIIENQKTAGRFTDVYANSDKTFYPIINKGKLIGIIIIMASEEFNDNEEMLWTSFMRQLGVAIEREMLITKAKNLSVINESDKLYQTLFSSISHEFRSPVTTILTGSETLKSINNYKYKEIANAIFFSAKRLHRLIENLLGMTRIASGHLSLRLDYYDVNDLTNSTLSQLENELSTHSISVYIPEDMPLVKIDIGIFEQILYNLIYNSILYTFDGSHIEISFLHQKENFIMEVMDNGDGFSEETLQNIFEKFYRGSQRIGGIGLGLSTIKGYVDAHKGTITAQNRPSGGALIRISIPSPSPIFQL